MLSNNPFTIAGSNWVKPPVPLPPMSDHFRSHSPSKSCDGVTPPTKTTARKGGRSSIPATAPNSSVPNCFSIMVIQRFSILQASSLVTLPAFTDPKYPSNRQSSYDGARRKIKSLSPSVVTISLAFSLVVIAIVPPFQPPFSFSLPRIFKYLAVPGSLVMLLKVLKRGRFTRWKSQVQILQRPHCLASRRLEFLADHWLVCGLFYGIAVFLVMNLVVLSLSALHLTGPYQLGGLIQGLLGHMSVVGLPISFSLHRFAK
jgi:hypothetical protein